MDAEKVIDSYARLLAQMNWPIDMAVRGEDDKPFLPPRVVIDRLMDIYEKEDLWVFDREETIWVFETELGVDLPPLESSQTVQEAR